MNKEVKARYFMCDECKKEEYLFDKGPFDSFRRPKGWGAVSAIIKIFNSVKHTYYNQDYCEECYPVMLEKMQIQEVFK